jgi:hypothetical protein
VKITKKVTTIHQKQKYFYFCVSSLEGKALVCIEKKKKKVNASMTAS